MECILGKPDAHGAVLAGVAGGRWRCDAGEPFDVAAYGSEGWVVCVCHYDCRFVSIFKQRTTDG